MFKKIKDVIAQQGHTGIKHLCMFVEALSLTKCSFVRNRQISTLIS